MFGARHKYFTSDINIWHSTPILIDVYWNSAIGKNHIYKHSPAGELQMRKNLGNLDEVPDSHGEPNGPQNRIPGISRVPRMYLDFRSSSNPIGAKSFECEEQDYPVISLRFRVESCTLKKDVATQGPGQGAPGQGAPAQPNTPYLGYRRKLELRIVPY